MFELIILMLQKVGLLIIVAFLLSRMKSFQQIIHKENGIKDRIIMVSIFGIFGVISNYTGIQIEQGFIQRDVWQTEIETGGAIANTRIMGVVIGGFLGGPVVGIGVGLIAGLHRLTLGGFTAVACGLSTIFAGVVTGVLSKHFNLNKQFSLKYPVIIGIVMEIIQMGFILVFVKPFTSALSLVEIIALPMILINGFGTLLFMLIIKMMVVEEERKYALQTQMTLQIAQLTLPYFRQGLNERSCQKVAEIIWEKTRADAISITNREQVLAHIGAGADHHIQKREIWTRLTKEVLEIGEIISAKSREEIGCLQKNCPLQAAVVLPLIAHQQTVGTLKMYFTNANNLTEVEERLAEGLSKLFSMQLELAEAELQRRLLKDAEIKALQAQVHPHFLFNSINTISSLVRTDANKARKLLLHLSTFFRSNIHGARQLLIPLEKELEHVEAYLSIEQTRFPNKYNISIDIHEELKTVLVPPFTLQPLVENAIQHAFRKSRSGEVKIRALIEDNHMILTTEDNGIGIHEGLINNLGNETVQSEKGTGTSLWNIKKRIEELYGDEASFSISSKEDTGTKIIIIVPIRRISVEGEYD